MCTAAHYQSANLHFAGLRLSLASELQSVKFDLRTFRGGARDTFEVDKVVLQDKDVFRLPLG
jgi:hypothetical protein